MYIPRLEIEYTAIEDCSDTVERTVEDTDDFPFTEKPIIVLEVLIDNLAKTDEIESQITI